jgi:predicted  nucleic acid-binding Zn-ribbon protein
MHEICIKCGETTETVSQRFDFGTKWLCGRCGWLLYVDYDDEPEPDEWQDDEDD